LTAPPPWFVVTLMSFPPPSRAASHRAGQNPFPLSSIELKGLPPFFFFPLLPLGILWPPPPPLFLPFFAQGHEPTPPSSPKGLGNVPVPNPPAEIPFPLFLIESRLLRKPFSFPTTMTWASQKFRLVAEAFFFRSFAHRTNPLVLSFF